VIKCENRVWTGEIRLAISARVVDRLD